MGVVAELKHTQVMDWDKYTLDEWLAQYGAYISICRMRGGNEPDNLGVNQIYWLVREANGSQSKKGQTVYLQISDFEYEQIDKLIRELNSSKRIPGYAKPAIQIYLHKAISGMSLDQMNNEFCLSRSSINSMVYCGKWYILGHDKRLKV